MGKKTDLIRAMQRAREGCDAVLNQIITGMAQLPVGNRVNYNVEIAYIDNTLNPAFATFNDRMSDLDTAIRGLRKYIKDNTFLIETIKKSQRETADRWKTEAEDYRREAIQTFIAAVEPRVAWLRAIKPQVATYVGDLLELPLDL